MEGYIKVKDHPGLVRDKQSSAILNTNSSSLDKYKQEREEKQKLNEAVAGYPQLREDVSEIKALLLRLLEKDN